MGTLRPLSSSERWALIAISWVIVAFGQPAWSVMLSMAAGCFGFALLWRALVDIAMPKQRFWIGTFWFAAVQMLQLSWALSHPYAYIYGVYFLYCFLMGLQFGALALFATPARLYSLWSLAGIAGGWAILEWMRLFFFSGFSWNPIGLSLSSNLYSIQMGSIGGVFGLSFWVLWTNLLAMRAWTYRWAWGPVALFGTMALFPYVFGVWQLWRHSSPETETSVKAVLVQTAFPVEECLDFPDAGSQVAFVLDEWRQILSHLHSYKGKSIDLVALPEFTVPYGTYTMVYPWSKVVELFSGAFGAEAVAALPEPSTPYGAYLKTFLGEVPFVSNAFFLQGIANILNVTVVAGLEDAEDQPDGSRRFYSSAQCAMPNGAPFIRYDKRVLVPMGEYIPFRWCRELAKSYGVMGSFTSGQDPKLMWIRNEIPFATSICYEETFGHLMRDNRHVGALFLLNLTSDVWYPNSKLPRQHLDHAKLRTVENGIPLLRACNTGITCAVDAFGRELSVLGNTPREREWMQGTLLVELPLHSYSTIYSRLGDYLVVVLSCFFIVGAFFFRPHK